MPCLEVVMKRLEQCACSLDLRRCFGEPKLPPGALDRTLLGMGIFASSNPFVEKIHKPLGHTEDDRRLTRATPVRVGKPVVNGLIVLRAISLVLGQRIATDDPPIWN